ncbi:MAG: iron export ABC transporter permease subunit FetB [Deltaproteobacteria bacterium]|nr:iron export ABC transporter permease subunit FetB [Deltaproteobacteria bacterium]
MNVIPLSAVDLLMASFLVLVLALLSFRMRLGLSGQLLVAACRTTVQLLLVGMVLRTVFAHAKPVWVALMAAVMLAAAAREVMARQHRPFKGWWGVGVGGAAMFISSFAVAIMALVVIVGAEPWYTPRYAIPLLGMLLGNTMNGISLGVNSLTQAAWEKRDQLEQRLLLGQDRKMVLADIRQNSMRTGMIPIINAMAAAGLVSLPGMMTGQILAGSSVLEAVKYQILIMFLISSGTGFGILAALQLASRRLFDNRHRLRLDNLRGEEDP